jgi:NAD(P)H dehydrogenase (quinone)
MSKVLVTGASGQLGRKTLRQLLLRRPAGELAGLARDPAKAADLTAAGVEIRTGDYTSYESLLDAFVGVEKLLLVPTHAFTDRAAQHRNVISAAREAGVEHVVYTPIIRKPGSGLHLAEITEPDRVTEQALEASGLAYTIAAHPPFMESFQGYIGDQPTCVVSVCRTATAGSRRRPAMTLPRRRPSC